MLGRILPTRSLRPRPAWVYSAYAAHSGGKPGLSVALGAGPFTIVPFNGLHALYY
nr:MAG TPA: hypothetical protein [Caudoviricetes sp.]